MDIEEMVLRLKPGDIAIVRVPDHWDEWDTKEYMTAIESLGNAFQRALEQVGLADKTSVIITEKGLQIEVLRVTDA